MASTRLRSVGAEITIAQTKREAIRVAHNRAAANFNRQIQVARYLFDYGELLPIFLAEKSRVWLGGKKQLEHHGGNTGEMRRSKTPFPILRTAPTVTVV